MAAGRARRRADRSRLHLVVGEAGIGKTRVVDALVEHLRDAGTRVAAMRCYPGEVSLAFAPIVELLRAAIADAPVRLLDSLPERTLAEVGRLVPDLLEATLSDSPPPLDSPGAQAILFASVWEVLDVCLGGRDRGMVVVDDLHAADPSSLELLGYGLRRLDDHALDVVACLREEDAPTGVRRLIDDVATHTDVRVVTLQRLSEDDVAELTRTALPDAASARLPGRLHADSEGLPLLLVEYLRLLADGTADPDDPDGWELPHGAHDLARSRLASVSETGRQLASAAAAIGRSFHLKTLRQASGRADEELVSGLEELIDRRLVRELPADSGELRYDFVHDKLRAAVYDEISLARRRLLHGRVADALASGRAPGAVAASAAAIGEHARLAGHDAQAADWFVEAGNHARSLFANSEAVTHLERAVALGHAESWWLRATIGELQVLLGDYPAAASALEAAAAQATQAHELAWTEHRLGELALRRGEHDSAASHLSTAAALAADTNPGLEARIAADRGLLRLRAGDLEAATAHAEEAATLADTGDDTEARAQALNLLGVIARHRGDHDSARYELGRSAALAAELDDPAAHVAALNNLALATAGAGDLEGAIDVQRRAVASGQRRGDRHREAALRNNLADLLHQSGQEQAALEMLEQAVALFAAVDAQERPSPEIWKLVDW
jgi:predicted ATPase